MTIVATDFKRDQGFAFLSVSLRDPPPLKVFMTPCLRISFLLHKKVNQDQKLDQQSKSKVNTLKQKSKAKSTDQNLDQLIKNYIKS